MPCAGMRGRPLWDVRLCGRAGRGHGGMCGHVRPRAALCGRAATNGAMCGHVRPSAMGCAAMCGRAGRGQGGMCGLLCGAVRACAAARGPVWPRGHERCHVRACAAPCAGMCGQSLSKQLRCGRLLHRHMSRCPWRSDCTSFPAHATHMCAQSQTAFKGENRTGTTCMVSKLRAHTPAHGRTCAHVTRSLCVDDKNNSTCGAHAAHIPAQRAHMPSTNRSHIPRNRTKIASPV